MEYNNLMKDYWFKAKTYGYGWYPANIKGWIVLILFLAIITVTSLQLIPTFNNNHTQIALYFLQIGFWTTILLFTCYKKGEKLKWRWGKKAKEVL